MNLNKLRLILVGGNGTSLPDWIGQESNQALYLPLQWSSQHVQHVQEPREHLAGLTTPGDEARPFQVLGLMAMVLPPFRWSGCG